MKMKTQPNIRFKEYGDTWKPHNFEEIFSIIPDSNSNVSKDKYLSHGKYPIIDQSKEYIVGYSNGEKPIIPQKGGHIIFGDHTRELKFVNFPYFTGADGTQILENIGICHTLFLYHYCTSIKIPNTGYNRHLKYLKENIFRFPLSLLEQKQIADWFQSFDRLIETTEKKIDSLKQIKAASMQSMFPQEGEKTPRVRFQGYNEEWRTLTIEDVCEKRSSSLSENSLGLNRGDYPVYGATGYIQNIPSYQFDKPYIGIIKDGSGVGRSQLYPEYSSILGTMQYIIAKENIDTVFLGYLFQTIDFTSYIIGSSIPHIYYKDYCKQIIKIPSLIEQQKIADYFANLDSQIELQSRRLEKLNQIKAACLDNMFV